MARFDTSPQSGKKKKKEKNFAVIDGETDPFLFGRVPKPFLWGFYDGYIFKTFTETKNLVEFLRGQEITIYAHNGGKFDYDFMFSYLEPFQKVTIINGRWSKMKLGKCTLVDSYNIMPVALSAYQKTEINYEKFEENIRHNHMQEITNYLRDDCVYLYDLVKSYREEYGADLTQAGGAIKTFEKMRSEKSPRHRDIKTFHLFKPFYYGGRVECFKKGIIEKSFNVYDINSAYPFAMTYRHPFGMSFEYGDRELPFQDNVRVFYRLECISRGAFPFREKPNSGIDFPNDNILREYTITDWEYWTAKNAGLISQVKIIECVRFSETLDFNEYVTYFYEGRQQAKRDGDKKKDLLYKLRLNSLYGKFGSDYTKYENFIILPEDFNSTEWEKRGDIGNETALYSKPLAEDEMHFYNVATAASITGFVRAYLLAAMVNVGFDNLLYCDTDSLAVHSGKGINVGNQLGDWKDEGKFIKAGIAGKKLYVFKPEKGACKIASKGARLTSAEIWRVCRGDTVNYKKDSPCFSITGKARFIERNIKMT